MKGKWLNS